MAVPPAFLELGIVLNVVLFCMTLFITAMGYRLYHLFRKPRYLKFSTGFLLISIGYIFSALTTVAYAYLSQERLIAVFTLLWFIPVLAGLLLLTYLYYDIGERMLQLLLAAIIATAFLLGGAGDFAFFILSGVLFFFIAVKLYLRYRANPERDALIVLLGFSLLFVSKLLSGALFLHDGVYIGYYLFKLAGVMLIARSLWVISR